MPKTNSNGTKTVIDPKKTKTVKIEIQSIPRPELITVIIKGTTSYLSHKKDMRAGLEHEKKTMGNKSAQRIINPDDEWEASLYRHPKTKKPCILGRALKSSIVEAARTYWPLGTGKKINGTVDPTEEFIAIKFSRMEKRRDWLPLQKGGHHMSYRCEFFDWSAEVKFVYDAGHVSPSLLINLLSRAGFSVGVGDDRPGKGKGGIHGKFTVEGTK